MSVLGPHTAILKEAPCIICLYQGHGVPPHEGSGPSTCQSWDLHGHCPREDRTFLQDRWLLPISLLLTGDPIKVVLHIGEPLATVTTQSSEIRQPNCHHSQSRACQSREGQPHSGLPHKTRAPEPQITGTNTTLWPCRPPRSRQRARAHRCPSTPCPFQSVNCGRPTRPSILTQAPLTHSVHSHQLFPGSKCLCSSLWCCWPLVTSPQYYPCTTCYYR